MATAAGYFDRKPSSSVRPGLSHLQPSSPHTPTQQRTVSSAFSSPSISYRAEEDAIIFEFGARHFSAGFAGESYPRCKLGFGPEQSRRAGDYRAWLPGYDERPRRRRQISTWGDEHELWRMDLRGLDLGLVEDKIERTLREAYTRYLLVDSKSRRLMVIVPSVMPQQLLSTLLSTLLINFSMPSVTLLSPPILSTLAAGCRSGLVVDIGWRETIVTGVYEYREILESRTTRAMRAVTLQMAKLLEKYDSKRESKPSVPASRVSQGEDDPILSIDLEKAEEVTTRMAWCKGRKETIATTSESQNVSALLSKVPFAKDSSGPTTPTQSSLDGPPISIPSPSSPRHSIQIPVSLFASPVETALLAPSLQAHDLDDHNQPLHLLIYKSLLSLPPDVRSLCMSRIIFTGGGSHIPGLKSRLLDEVSALVEARGWDPVSGKAADEHRQRLNVISNNRRMKNAESEEATTPTVDNPAGKLPASLASQEADPIEEKIRRDQKKGLKLAPNVSGIVRGVETLGAWAGGSLLANLRIKGIVEIERDSFLQSGLAGARKEAEISVAPQRGVGRGGMGEKMGWTLGAWA